MQGGKKEPFLVCVCVFLFCLLETDVNQRLFRERERDRDREVSYFNSASFNPKKRSSAVVGSTKFVHATVGILSTLYVLACRIMVVKVDPCLCGCVPCNTCDVDQALLTPFAC